MSLSDSSSDDDSDDDFEITGYGCSHSYNKDPCAKCEQVRRVDRLEKRVTHQKNAMKSLKEQLATALALISQLERRITIVEFTPGNVEFNKILAEAKEAGDFS